MLKIEHLHVWVEGKEILKGVDLTVRPGKIHAIMGPNGSGKSTLAYTLMGHPNYKLAESNVKSSSGPGQRQKSKVTIEIDGKSLIDKTPDERARMGLFLAFQYPIAVEGVSVQNFIRKASEALNGRSMLSVLKFREALKKRAEQLGIKEELLARSLNDGFSGGEKKRVEILQMAALQPKYAILDETDSGLDIDALRIVAQGVRRVTEDNKRLSVILITHYQRILQFIKPDVVHIMIDGKVVKRGGAELARELERTGYQEFLISH